MRASTRLVAVGASAAVAAGAGCIAVGQAVLAEPGQLAAARATLAEPRPVATAVPPAGAAGSLLGTDGDHLALQAAADALGARTVAVRRQAERELAVLAVGGPADRRAWAATLLATLQLEQPVGAAGTQRRAAEALTLLRLAVAADPANEDAKRNLELLLSLEQRQKQRSRRHGSGGRARKTRTPGGHAGAGYGW